MPSMDRPLIEALVPDVADWPVFIETGTYQGQTIFAMEPLFEELHTIELAESLWNSTKQKYRGKKITFHHGDSMEVLPRLLAAIPRPAVFFLDGHWSGGMTGRGSIDVPLLSELKAICDQFPFPAIVIVDDLRLFGRGPLTGERVDWTKINTRTLREVVLNRCDSFIEDVQSDKLLIRLA